MKNLLILVLFTVSLSTLSAQVDSLIPREVFFDNSEQKALFKINPSGNKVYYIKNLSQLGNKLFYFDIVQHKEIKLDLDQPFIDYHVFKDDQILFNFRMPSGQTFGVYNIKTKRLQNFEPFPIAQSKIYDINVTGQKAVAILVGQNGEKGIYHFDLEGNFEKIRAPEGFFNYHFDEQLNIIAGEKFNEQQGKSFYYLKNDDWKLLRSYSWYVDMFVRGVNNILAVSNNGQFIFFSDNSQSDITQLRKFDITKEEEEILFEDTKSDLLPKNISFDLQKHPTSVVSEFGKAHRYMLAPEKVKEDFIFLNKKIQDLNILDASQNNNIWLVENMNGGANEYYIYNRQEKQLDFLFTDFPAIEPYAKNLRTAFTVTSFDGLQLPVNLYLREDLDKNKDGIPDQPLPTILYVHGGPWVGWMHNNWLITRNLQLLANRGYAVIFTEFRGSSTYGKNFVEKSNHQWGEAMVKDKEAIAKWAIQNNIAIADKVGIFGWSYGGYAVMAGLAFSPDTYACGIAMYGIADLNSFLATDFANNNTWRTRVADIQTMEGSALAKKHSPINHVEQIQAPLLLSTGGKDARVHHSQSDSMAEQMKVAQKEVSYIFYPDEVHDYRHPESWVSFWGFAESFLHQHLGGRYIPFEPSSSKGNFVYK